MVMPNTYITLTSNRASGFYKLIGGVGPDVLWVYGLLTIDGIIVTQGGCGVTVWEDGKLVMNSCVISGNHDAFGGCVFVYPNGTFVLNGGRITNNEWCWYGGGVCVRSGTFIMTGGLIDNNTVYYNDIFRDNKVCYTDGGGVAVQYANCSFVMSGGEISRNTAKNGGGVYVGNGAFFEMSGGKISDNKANGEGGGVAVYGSFSMADGSITDNVAKEDGGVYVWYGGSFSRSGGVISGNIEGDVNLPDYNNGSSDGNSADSNGQGNLSDDEYGSLNWDMVLNCIIVIAVAVGVIVAILLFVSKTKLKFIEEKK
jgi:hypothetical protein